MTRPLGYAATASVLGDGGMPAAAGARRMLVPYDARHPAPGPRPGAARAAVAGPRRPAAPGAAP